MELFKIYESADSTNKELTRLIANGVTSNGMAIMALHLTEGTGQYGRQWHAEKDKHLALSILYKPANLFTESLPHISMKVSLALIRILTTHLPFAKPSIKWPNDIYVNGKKIAGILIENTLQGNRIQHSIIGIGVNINEDAFPPGIHNATSMYLISQKEFVITDIAKQIVEMVLSCLDANSSAWKTEYDKYIYGMGQHAPFEVNKEKMTCMIKGIDLEGKIMLQCGETTKSYFAHEIKWII